MDLDKLRCRQRRKDSEIMTETGGSGGGGGGEVMMWSLWNQNIVSEDNFYIFKSEKEKDWACCCVCVGGGRHIDV